MGTTPVFNIPYPDAGTKANQLATKLEEFAEGVEAALLAAEIPPAAPAAIIVAPSQLARDLHWGVPADATERLALQNSGATTIRTDKGWDERYFAALTDGGSNPGGRAMAGWYRTAPAWTSYPAVLTGFSVGTGSGAVNSTEYRNEGDLIRVRYHFAFGPTAPIFPTTPKISLPAAAAAAAHPYTFLNGGGDVFDASATRPIQSWIITDAALTTTVRIAMRVTTGDGYDYPTPGTPFAWAVGDMMQGEFTYKPAA